MNHVLEAREKLDLAVAEFLQATRGVTLIHFELVMSGINPDEFGQAEQTSYVTTVGQAEQTPYVTTVGRLHQPDYVSVGLLQTALSMRESGDDRE